MAKTERSNADREATEVLELITDRNEETEQIADEIIQPPIPKEK